MNLLIFTPVNANSSIGGVTALVVHELIAQGCHVVVVSTESRDLIIAQCHNFATWILPWDDELVIRSLIQSADACIYQIGNHFAYHEGALRWLFEFPGLICLHDFYLGHLFASWAELNRVHADFILDQWYGSELARQFFTYSDSQSFIHATSQLMPMTEWVCAKADAVITHSQWGCGRVLKACPGPVLVVPLPPDSIIYPIGIGGSEGRTLNILAIGHVNPNKRVEDLLEAIGASQSLRERAILRLIGHIEPAVRQSLMVLASGLGVNLVIEGVVDENNLINAIEQCDVVSCLRLPVLEAASGAVVKAMLYGKAVIVANAGFYAELPISCAVKIDPDINNLQLSSALEDLLNDKAKVRRMGAEARRWASETFTSKHYAHQLIALVARMHSVIPINRALVNICLMYRHWSPVRAFLDSPEIMHPLRIFDITGKDI